MLKKSFNLILLLAFISSQFVFGQESEVSTIKLPERGICAHRGERTVFPENTIVSFKEAARLGAQMIEFDVRMTKDGYLVIMHDKSVDRTTNGSGLVSDLTLAEIKDLDAGSWKSKKFKGEKVPTFREALRSMPNNCWLNIHIKGGAELGRKTAEVLVSENRLQQGIISCGAEAGKAVRDVNKNIIIGNMERLDSRSEYVRETANGDYAFIQLKRKRDNKNLASDIKKLKDAGVEINYYYSDDEVVVRELLESGIDFVLTNKLEEMLEVSDALGIKRSN